MPVTPKYSLPFENVSDQPGITLHGGLSGTEDILAEAVEDEIERVDDDLVGLGDRLTVVETEGVLGWSYMDHGAASGVESFLIDCTVGSKYPPGTFDMMRLHMRGNLDVTGLMTLRVNEDSTSSRHRWGYMILNNTDNSVVDAAVGDTTTWRLGQWSTAFGIAEITLMDTATSTGSSQRPFFKATLQRISSTSGAHNHSRSHGRFLDGQQTESLRVFSHSSEINQCTWWLEGFRTP